ncbi:MAG: hypothetical protein Aurels2KO_54970 [Aureliella sp.]
MAKGKQQPSPEPEKDDPSLLDKVGKAVGGKVRGAFSKDKMLQAAHEIHGALEHGNTELANMLLHGHPAPVYANAMSPNTPQQEAVTPIGNEVSSPVEPGPVDAAMAKLNAPSTVAATQEMVTSHGPSSKETGVVDQRMEALQAMEETQEPEQEQSK